MINPESLVGRQIDQFRLDQYLARGAMGLVFRAFDTVLVRTVALKLIPKAIEEGLSKEELAAREEARKRLIQEAKAAGRLTHPNIVTIHSYGESEEFEYICMEFVTGETLAHMLRERKAVPIEDAIPIVEQILLALQTANQEKIVHRDIKPSNVMVTLDKRVKVMDFGIAKLPSLSMTITGTVLGTPYYMSPEQISGQKVDIRSDIFSLGAVFYEMLTGERPFEAENTATLAYKIVQVEPIPPKVLNIHIPSTVGSIISKALAKDPTLRYQAPSEMLRDLRALKEQLASGKTHPAEATAPGAVREPERANQPPKAAPGGAAETCPPVPSAQIAKQPALIRPPESSPAAPTPVVRTVKKEAGVSAPTPAAAHPPPPAQGSPPGKEPPADVEAKSSRPAEMKAAEEARFGSTATQPASLKRKTAGLSGLSVGRKKPSNALRLVPVGAAALLLVVVGFVFMSRDSAGPPHAAGPSAKTAQNAAPAAKTDPQAVPGAKPAPEAAPIDGRETRMKADTLVLQARNVWQANPVGAQKILEEAIGLDPNNFEAYLHLARLITQKKDYANALQHYQNALRINNRAAEVYFNMGFIFLMQGDYDAAMTHYEACRALNPPYQDEVLTNLGMCHLKKKNPAQALELFRQALDLNPNNSVAKSYLAGLPAPTQDSSSGQGPPGPASAASTAAQPGSPGGEQAGQSADALVLEAKDHMQSDPARAQKLLEDAVGMDPNHFDAISQLARLLTLKKDYAAAAQYYLAALRINQKSADVFFNLGYIYLNQGDYDQAQANYESCLALSPAYKDEILTNLGIVHLKKDNPAEARSMFRRALEANPRNRLAQNHLNNLNKQAAKGIVGKP